MTDDLAFTNHSPMTEISLVLKTKVCDGHDFVFTSHNPQLMTDVRDSCLQATVNRSKGNKTEVSKSELIHKSAYCRVSGN
jgi:hypothetical protein